MLAAFTIKGKTFRADLGKPLDISTPIRASEENLRAWYVGPPRMEPVVMGDFIGDVSMGGPVNFRDIYFNPHGHGTHTECVGHISREFFSIHDCLKNFFFLCRVITLTPERKGDDRVVTKNQLEGIVPEEALALRTLPNGSEKLSFHYSGTNPPYVEAAAMQHLIENGVNHFLIDTPSVDPEKDGGKLAAHHAFWEYPHRTQKHRTITELIYIPDEVKDGIYLLNLQVASFVNDATPSKPVLFEIV